MPVARDVDYPGTLRLTIDATDTRRGILQARLRIPVSRSGPMILLYPKWMPGYHAPQNPLALFAGLNILAGDLKLDWRRDPIEVFAFHIEVPEGVDVLDASFQFLSPTSDAQGDVVVTQDMLTLHWGRLVIYPAGHFARRIRVEARVILPEGWSYATALEPAGVDGAATVFKDVALDRLVDSPLMAGLHSRELVLDDARDVRMRLFAHQQELLAATEEQIDLHRRLVAESVAVFNSTHFDRYRFMVALTSELGGGGVEHHQSAEIVAEPTYFTEWARHMPRRDVMAHEFTHSWNGKFRRGADSWSPSFEVPIRNSLMWLYEGQTQYWGHVLTARSGLWSIDSALEALAKVAATYDVRPGGIWRTMADTTRDPVIAQRAPLPWASWQRSEDYYSQGQLMWLAVDTLIRELTDDRRSLDDFAGAFFGIHDGSMLTQTYTFEDVVRGLSAVAEHDWAAYLKGELESREPGAPLEGLERGGYRLVYRDRRSDFCKSFDALNGQIDMRFSIGLTVTDDGTLQEVMWGSPAFDAGLVAGAALKTVNGQDYSADVLHDAVGSSAGGTPIELVVNVRGRERTVTVRCAGGLRFPHLDPIAGRRQRLREILSPTAR